MGTSNLLASSFTTLTDIFSIAHVDGVIEANNPTVYDNQASVAIACINAGAAEGIVEFGGVVQDAVDVDWPATPSGASTLTVGNMDTTGLTIGQSYELKVYKPISPYNDLVTFFNGDSVQFTNLDVAGFEN